MEIVDHRHAAWYLAAEGDALLLDANCNHGAFGYSVLVELDADERARYEAYGSAFLDDLAEAIHMSAPIVDDASPYRARDLTRTRRAELSDAVRRWRDRDP